MRKNVGRSKRRRKQLCSTRINNNISRTKYYEYHDYLFGLKIEMICVAADHLNGSSL